MFLSIKLEFYYWAFRSFRKFSSQTHFPKDFLVKFLCFTTQILPPFSRNHSNIFLLGILNTTFILSDIRKWNLCGWLWYSLRFIRFTFCNYYRLLSDGYDSDSTLIRKTGRIPLVDPEQQKAWYKEIQKGGEIPLTGLRKSVPEKPAGKYHSKRKKPSNTYCFSLNCFWLIKEYDVIQ